MPERILLLLLLFNTSSTKVYNKIKAIKNISHYPLPSVLQYNNISLLLPRYIYIYIYKAFVHNIYINLPNNSITIDKIFLNEYIK